VSHLSACLEPVRCVLNANVLNWITDTTPHEALPYTGKEPAMRQFFRVVAGGLSLWYPQHSTANPRVPNSLIILAILITLRCLSLRASKWFKRENSELSTSTVMNNTYKYSRNVNYKNISERQNNQSKENKSKAMHRMASLRTY
jgi:hypothetical protein